MNTVYKTVMLTALFILMTIALSLTLMIAAAPLAIMLLVDLISLKLVYDSLLTLDSSIFLTLAYFAFVVGMNYYVVTQFFIPTWEIVKVKLGELNSLIGD